MLKRNLRKGMANELELCCALCILSDRANSASVVWRWVLGHLVSPQKHLIEVHLLDTTISALLMDVLSLAHSILWALFCSCGLDVRHQQLSTPTWPTHQFSNFSHPRVSQPKCKCRGYWPSWRVGGRFNLSHCRNACDPDRSFVQVWQEWMHANWNRSLFFFLNARKL